MSADKHYTAKDFERYHSGEMSDVEMHALEKAALDDPFLDDALIGYKITGSPARDMNELRNRLLNKGIKRKKVALLNTRNLVKIAAIFIVIAGIGWMVYQNLEHKENDKVLAAQPSVVTQTDVLQSEYDSMLTTPLLPDSNINVAEPIKNNKRLTPSTSKTNNANQVNSVNQKDARPSADELKDVTLLESDKISAVQGQGNNNSDSGEVFSRQKADYRIKEEVSAKILTEKTTQAPAATSSQLNWPLITAKNAMPVKGWAVFNKVIADKNLKTEQNLQGLSTITFKTDLRGIPVNIKGKGICYKCNEIAEEIIKIFKWTLYDHKQYGEITFQF